ncbi:long-chain fatty acid--CoA ligase [Seongchinamella unica]|uniref:Long-chain fatty acid--CoA ligase n=1 Tax=Seongchinamella unica TaxID=2547392 RepID=A0A4R5LMP4_9GAMM|nr:class I adenylate-forming enzyme family protein [Seongchinamella unica]TDG11307.1 long-chain fatty acid--CoA ligase [Seongchinamella unica]
MNTFTLLEMTATSFPERIAVHSDGRDITYSALYRAACGAAATFQKSGCQYVSVLDVNSPAVPIALYGAAAAGLSFVPLNYRLTEVELDKLKARIQPLYLVDQVGREDFIAKSMAYEGESPKVPDDPRAIAVQLFTSGTTGAPKAAVLRHENLMSYILGTVEFAGADQNEASLVSVPPYHIAGISAVLSAVYAGRKLVQLPNFDADDWMKLVENQQVTHAFLVPTMLSRIVETIDAGRNACNLGSLRAIAYGGGNMPEAVIRRALEIFPQVAFTNAYGLTETSSTIALMTPDDHREALSSNDPQIAGRLQSVGKPLASVEVEIRDDSGNVLAAGSVGEVYVRGAQVSGEYLERKATTSDGWFPTRDRGYLDKLGYLYLMGRADDIIVRGGENISPGEIEDVLTSHEAIADACVVGIPDSDWGECVVAAVVLAHGKWVDVAALQQLVRGKMRSSRVPGEIRFLPSLPYNEMGKLLRRTVREAFCPPAT